MTPFKTGPSMMAVIRAGVLLAAMSLFPGSVSLAASGDIEWKGWKFSYATNTGNALELQQVYFNNRKILNRASFPVMRVEYDNDVCGPYADIIWQHSYVPIDISPPYDSCNGTGLCDNDQILKNRGNLQTSEFNDRKTDTSYWTIRDAETGLRVEVIPGQTDGFPDDFSRWDVAARKRYDSEISNWRLGARGEIGDHYNNSESIDREDIVFWYISHLDHKALEGSLKWHASGPRILVVNPDQ